MKDKHVKDTAKDVVEDVAKYVAEDVLGATEDGSVKLLIVARAISPAEEPTPNTRMPPPTLPLGET